MAFWNDILELRRRNLIPRQWRREHIIPYLKDKYQASTIWTVPSNQSISKDGKIQGNYVQRGMQPKAYRIAVGLFQLIEEPSGEAKLSHQKSANRKGPRQEPRSTKVISSGRSRNIRLPSEFVQEYGLSGPLILEKTPEGVLLRKDKLSWKETALQMAEGAEDWSLFDIAIADGLNSDP